MCGVHLGGTLLLHRELLRLAQGLRRLDCSCFVEVLLRSTRLGEDRLDERGHESSAMTF